MALFILITEHCKQDARARTLESEVENLRKKMLRDQYNHLEPFPPHYHRKRFRKQDRMIAREQLVDDHVVVVFLGIISRGDEVYESRFLKDALRDKFVNSFFGPPIEDSVLRNFIQNQTKTDAPQQKPRPNEQERKVLFEVLAGAKGSLDDNLVFESQEWVSRTSEERVQERLLLLQSGLQQILERRIPTEQSYFQNPTGQIGFVFRNFPNIRKVFLAGITLAGEGDAARKAIERRYEPVLKGSEDASTDELIRKCSERGFPGTILYGADEWLAIEKEKGANLALSEEETRVLEGARSTHEETGGYPLFVNGRAGSGKSTILQYLFEEYIYYALINDPDARLLPVYFTCSEGLLRTARVVVENLMRCSYKRQLGEKTARERDLILHQKREQFLHCFKEFHEYLLGTLPPEIRFTRYPRSRRVDFRAFKNLWLARFQRRKDLSGWNAEVCWHAIRSYIKGFSVEDYLEPDEFGGLPRAERTVTEPTYKRIYEEVWDDWYRDLCETKGYWDDQDLAREVLTKEFAKARFVGIFCDEAQDFTRLEIELIHRLCLYSERSLFPVEVRNVPFMFAGDPFQTVNPTGFHWDAIRAGFHVKLIKNLDPSNRARASVQYRELTFNYRSTANIVRFCNLIQALRKVLFDIAEADLRPQTHWKTEPNSPLPVFYSKDKDISLVKEFLRTQTDVTIIVPCDEGGEVEFVDQDQILREVVKRDETNVPQNVLSPSRAKGQEFPRVVLYGFGDAAPEGLLDPIQGGSSYAQDSDRSLPFEYFMNRLYVAASRPRRRLFVIDSDRGLNQFWGFAREEKTWASILEKLNAPDEWRNNVCLLHPGLAQAWMEEREDPAVSAEKYEEEGMRVGDPYWLRAAALQYESSGNISRQRVCRAMAKFYEGKWGEAGLELQECGQFQKAARAFWSDGVKASEKPTNKKDGTKVFEKTINQEALRKLVNVANVCPEIKTEIEWQLAEWECGDKNLDFTLRMLTALQERIKTLSFATTLADDKTMQEVTKSLFKSVASARCDQTTDQIWRELCELMSRVLKLGISIDQEHQGVLYHRADLHAQAVTAWNAGGKMTSTEYKRSLAISASYPANLEVLYELKDYTEICRLFELNKGVRLGPTQGRCVSEALLAKSQPGRALGLLSEHEYGPETAKVLQKVAPLVSKGELEKAATDILSVLLKLERWSECIDFVLDVREKLRQSDLSLRLQSQLVWEIARSPGLPGAPGVIQSRVADYLEDVFVKEILPRPPGVSNRVAGSAIERARRHVTAARFYEKLYSPHSQAPDKDKFFARTRWVKVKNRQADYEQGEGKTKNAERARNEAFRMLNDLPLEKDVAKIPDHPNLSEEDKPKAAGNTPVCFEGIEIDVQSDANKEIFKWSVGTFDFTFNVPRKFVLIASSTDGSTIRVSLEDASIKTSMNHDGTESATKRYFKEWGLSLDTTETVSAGQLVIRTSDPECQMTVRPQHSGAT